MMEEKNGLPLRRAVLPAVKTLPQQAAHQNLSKAGDKVEKDFKQVIDVNHPLWL